MKQIGRYVLILIAVLALWNTEVIKPLKIFTVFLHELGHALMAFVFGYGITEFKVNLNESGHTLVQSKGWFSSFMIANGGYLGSVLFALLILYLKKTAFRKFILGTIAIVFLFVTFRFSGLSFALIYSILFAIVVLVLYMWQNESVNDWLIDIIGISSVAYAIYDTFIDTVLLQLNIQLHLISGWKVSQPLTDAVQLSRLTGLPAILWGIIWLVLAISAVNAVLLKSSGAARRR
ncbi:MAG: hypothetical protein K0R31_2308 [Clostridiales bacterium]|jgi:hypothetical protein|nr:hypothetical protein [Clostridiales bacterium]